MPRCSTGAGQGLTKNPMSENCTAPIGSSAEIHPNYVSRARVRFWTLTLGSIGVVYGDIGTSPLYALREAVIAAVGSGNPASEPVILGILSLIVWTLIV